MKNYVFASALMLGLAACGGGGGGKAALVKACTDDGTSTAECECMADAAEQELDPATFNKLVDAANEGEEAAEEIMTNLTPEEQGKFMAFAMKAAMTCSAS